MRVKSNIPLSDNELRRVREVLTVAGQRAERLAELFPQTDINLTEDVLYIGKPPWDITQEINL